MCALSARSLPLTIDSIVAIHGIGADPDTTWGGRDSKGQRLNWLKDANMLPEAVPAARIMRFGYKSAWVDSETERGKTTFVSDIARMLLSDLASHRRVGHVLKGDPAQTLIS
jgi:hypothetical protein